MKTPLISVLLLTYNHEDYIYESVNSVFDQQSDEYDIELLVVDDGSSDHTAKILSEIQKDAPVSMNLYLKQHKGVSSIAKNLNELIKESNGDYIAFLSGDDKYFANRFKDHFKLLHNNENIMLVYSSGENYIDGQFVKNVMRDSEKIILQSKNAELVHQYIICKIPLLFIQALTVKKDILEKIGGFDEDLIADDWVLNIKLFKEISNQGLNYEFIDKPVFYRRILASSTSNNTDVHFQRVFEVINRYAPHGYKSKFLANTYWKFALKYIGQGEIKKAKDFFVKSQCLNFNIKLISKLPLVLTIMVLRHLYKALKHKNREI